MTEALIIVGLILLCGVIVAWCEWTDPEVLVDSRERRWIDIRRERSGGRW